MSVKTRRRCAIYTRKSTEAGLEQNFNSLAAQREACAAYIKSQAHEGWKLLAKHYDDGGLSGGSLDRPALQRLLADIEAGLIDIVVVYKVDRLTRALTDFAKLVEAFEARGVSFVSVTQQFNTTSSMGRLTLNVLLSFAQFEREVTAERIRDKVAQSEAKGIWMGGPVPLGYDLGERELLVNVAEAEQVRRIFALYLETGSVRTLKAELDRLGFRSKRRHHRNGRITGGGPFSRGHLYRLLANPIYIGKLSHKGKLHEGKQAAIVPLDLWEKVQEQLKANTQGNDVSVTKHPSLLAGKLETVTGEKLIPSHATKKGKRYRYYIEQRLVQNEGFGCKGLRFAAIEVETAVMEVLRRALTTPTDLIAALNPEDRAPGSLQGLINKAKRLATDLQDHRHAHSVLSQVIEKVIVHDDALALHIRKDQLASLLAAKSECEEPIHVLTSPCKLTRRGQDLKFILPLANDADAYARKDPALIQAVAKAHLWWDWIKTGEVASLAEIARREGVDKPKVTRLLRLAFLSPHLVRQIREGRQPANLTTKTLTRATELPLSWDEQARLVASLD